jgi:FecR protein
MTQEAAPLDAPRDWAPERRQVQFRRLVWFTVLAAFAIWAVLTVVFGRWALGVARTAAAPAPSAVEEVAGVTLYRQLGQRAEASARQGIQLYEGDELATSAGSVASLRIFDGSLLQLFPEARVRVNATRIGRINRAATEARFTLLAGAVRVSIPQMESKEHTVNFETGQGGVALVPGEYTLRAGSDGTRISVWEGRAAAAIGDQIIEIGERKKIVMPAGREGFAILDVLENTVKNADFAARFEEWTPWEDREQDRTDVPGRLDIVTPTEPGGPPKALRISRTSLVDAHNETGLRQTLERDVAGARRIVLQALVKLDLASLSGGGYLGSEYPMMVRIRYRDRRGAEQVWARGFYYANPENRPVALGQRIERGAWTAIDVDLTDVLIQPTSITSFEAFGAGHTFDASIGEIGLLVD